MSRLGNYIDFSISKGAPFLLQGIHVQLARKADFTFLASERHEYPTPPAKPFQTVESPPWTRFPKRMAAYNYIGVINTLSPQTNKHILLIILHPFLMVPLGEFVWISISLVIIFCILMTCKDIVRRN